MKILVIGGTRFFGKRLVRTLVDEDHEVTILSRGQCPDPFGDQVTRIHCDRKDPAALQLAVKGQAWDAIVDQVCMNAKEAEAACEIFAGHTNFYSFTSSQSVYRAGADLRESAFDPATYVYAGTADEQSDYPEAKRQAEAVFARRAGFKTAMVRFPIVLGEDDHTRRLEYHIERALDGREVYFPNLEARLNFIASEDAAEALFQVVNQRIAGPLNVAARTPIRLRDLLFMIENATGRALKVTAEPGTDNWSPFGVESDWFMNVERAAAHGIEPAELEDWLPALVKRLAQAKRETL